MAEAKAELSPTAWDVLGSLSAAEQSISAALPAALFEL